MVYVHNDVVCNTSRVFRAALTSMLNNPNIVLYVQLPHTCNGKENDQ